MKKLRIIPNLLMSNGCLVKTKKFKNPRYIGDPANTLRIFNELEVDELILLDITASKQGKGPDFEIIKDVAEECFMPLSYGGGISSIEDASHIFQLGVEKIVINSQALKTPELVEEIVKKYGSQSVIVSIDVKKKWPGLPRVVGKCKGENLRDPLTWAKYIEEKGAGEIFLTSIEKEGTWSGYDVDLVKTISAHLSIPVIANGGCGSIEHIEKIRDLTEVSAISVGSMITFQKKDMGVLINYPDSLRVISNNPVV